MILMKIVGVWTGLNRLEEREVDLNSGEEISVSNFHVI